MSKRKNKQTKPRNWYIIGGAILVVFFVLIYTSVSYYDISIIPTISSIQRGSSTTDLEQRIANIETQITIIRESEETLLNIIQELQETQVQDHADILELEAQLQVLTLIIDNQQTQIEALETRIVWLEENLQQ